MLLLPPPPLQLRPLPLNSLPFLNLRLRLLQRYRYRFLLLVALILVKVTSRLCSRSTFRNRLLPVMMLTFQRLIRRPSPCLWLSSKKDLLRLARFQLLLLSLLRPPLQLSQSLSLPKLLLLFLLMPMPPPNGRWLKRWPPSRLSRLLPLNRPLLLRQLKSKRLLM